MMARKREPPKRRDIEIEYGGKVHRGQYVEGAGGVTVFYESLEKWAMLYSAPAEHIAPVLLRELVREWLKKRESKK
jgi:hypothetical protein